MRISTKRKMFMGIGGFMIFIPKMMAAKGLEKGVAGAKAKAARLSADERKVHHFIVRKLAVVSEPITAELVSEELGLVL